MNAQPLSAPDGTIYAYACGRCRRVATGAAYMTDTYNDEQVAHLRDSSLTRAEVCCVCRVCGGVASNDICSKGAHRVCEVCWEDQRPERERHQAEWAERDRRSAEAYELALGVALDRDAAVRLRETMSEISEDLCCAGWMMGLETALWNFVVSGPGKYGMGEVTKGNIVELKRLSEKAGGWWRWDEAASETLFVQTAEWNP